MSIPSAEAGSTTTTTSASSNSTATDEKKKHQSLNGKSTSRRSKNGRPRRSTTTSTPPTVVVVATPLTPRTNNNRDDFIHSDHDEPHRQRRKEILAKHPEIKQLFGPDIRLLPAILIICMVQLSLAVYSVRLTSWSCWFLLAYSVGGTLTHWLSLGNHELSHNLCFKKTLYNEMLAMFANFAQGLPSAMTFKRYHLEHHYYQGYKGVDMDVPTAWEGRFFNSTLKKIGWVILQPAFYAIRPLLINPKPPSTKEAINTFSTIAFDAAFMYVFGIKALLFNIVSLLLGMGLHPVAGHLIAEHYTLSYHHRRKLNNKKSSTTTTQETFSYYGPLNWVTFNVGYHNEHHDFPRVPGFRLPQVKQLAPEFYDNLDSYDSWCSVIYQYITRPDIGPFSRVVRGGDAATARK